MKGLEITVETESRVQGVQVRENRTYSVYIGGDSEQEIKEQIEKGINISTKRLPLDAMIDVRIINENYSSSDLVRVISRWGEIELRKAIGFNFEIQEEYERKGHWKKRIREFIKKELNEHQETQKLIREGA